MTATLPKSFAIRCIEGVDQSINAESCIDRFQILGDGVPLFTLSFDYCSEGHEGDYDARLRSLTDLKPADLPFISDGIQLIGFVHRYLLDLMARIDCEFFADAFADDAGESLDHPIDFGIR